MPAVIEKKVTEAVSGDPGFEASKYNADGPVSRVKVSFDPHDNLMDDLRWMQTS